MKSRSAAAFTLLEILLVLGLIGLLSTVLIIGVNQMTTDQSPTPEDVFWKAVGECRKQALLSSQNVTLAFSNKDKQVALIATWKGGGQVFPFDTTEALKVDFLPASKGGSTILLGGQLVETTTLAHVTFYDDGTCTPFRAQLKFPGSEARMLAIDPWTCAAVLPAKDSR